MAGIDHFVRSISGPPTPASQQATEQSGMISTLKSLKPWLDAGLGFIYPEVCQICGKERATAAEGFVGQLCREKVRFIKSPFCARCGLPFEGDITTTFECHNCKEMELHFRTARSAVVAEG